MATYSNSQRKPYMLIILDGFGHRENADHNAILAAKTPHLDQLKASCPNGLISGSGLDVGLPEGQMGNSEVGHMNLGAGRVVYQDFTRISKSIKDGDFFQNEALTAAVKKAVSQDKAVHIMGLLSHGGVHSHVDHIRAMIDLAHQQGADKIYVHAFLDGRDTPPRSAEPHLKSIDEQLKTLNAGRIASIVGRYYAMDRDNRWDRVERAYRLLTESEAPFAASSAVEALQLAYQRGENDEFVQPTLIQGAHDAPATISDGDGVIFMNFRADRAREITRAFVDKNFDGFVRKQCPQLADFVMLTEYAANIEAPCAYPTHKLANVLGEYLSSLGKTQLRIAETEKYAHVTFFFSGGHEDCFPGEDRILVQSPNVATYDLQPEMSAPEVTDKLIEAAESGRYDVIICNFANGDMVGHTGNFDAAVKAIEALDSCIGRIAESLQRTGGECLITADHGNAEQMLDTHTGQAHTAHTSDPVPLIYIGRPGATLQTKGGVLSDIAPTLLTMMGIPQPQEMTGKSLLTFQESSD